MPLRLLRDGILTSDRVNSLGVHAELFYRRLMSVVDDYGRYDARPGVLRVQCYPLRVDAMREADISRLLAEVQEAGLIALYAVDGKQYLQLKDFRQRIRSPSRWPAPDGTVDMPMPAVGQADDGHVSDMCQTRGSHGSDTCRTKTETETEERVTPSRACAHEEPAPKAAAVVPFVKYPADEDEVKAEAERQGCPDFDAVGFYGHYSAIGWKTAGGVPILDWRRLVRKWHAGQRTIGTGAARGGGDGMSLAAIDAAVEKFKRSQRQEATR